MGLELYAEVESLLGFEEEINGLYSFFLEILNEWHPKSLIDVGCGSGKFLERAKKLQGIEKTMGIDLSYAMVERAKKRGLNAKVMDICAITERFDAATAVFDVLNYLSKDGLIRFLGCVEKCLNPGGVFIADINTLHGFEDVAQGDMIKDNDDRFVALNSIYENDRLVTKINYFEKKNSCYVRKDDTVIQYYHSLEEIITLTDLELIQSYPVTLYSDMPDKEILLFKKM